MDSDKAGNAKDLGNEELQLICKAYNRRLLSSQRVVDVINSMNYSKLKILCKYNNKFSYKNIEELLSNEETVDNINDYDDEMFRSMLNDAPSEEKILEILEGGEVLNTNNEFESSDSEENEEGEDCGYYDYEEDKKNDLNNFAKEALGNKGTNEKRVDDIQFCNDVDVGIPLENQNAIRNIRFIQWMIVESGKLSGQNATELLKDQSSIDRINSIGDKKLQLILKSNKFSGENIMELLGNQKVVEYLSFIDYEKFELIHNSDKFNSSKYASSSHKIIRLLENQKIVKHINFIDYEKLQFILRNDKFLLSDIIRLLENQEVVENIISFNIEKFRLIFYSDKLNCVDTIELLENQKVVNGIDLIPLEELESMCSHSSLSDIIKLLKDKNGPNSVLR